MASGRAVRVAGVPRHAARALAGGFSYTTLIRPAWPKLVFHPPFRYNFVSEYVGKCLVLSEVRTDENENDGPRV